MSNYLSQFAAQKKKLENLEESWGDDLDVSSLIHKEEAEIRGFGEIDQHMNIYIYQELKRSLTEFWQDGKKPGYSTSEGDILYKG